MEGFLTKAQKPCQTLQAETLICFTYKELRPMYELNSYMIKTLTSSIGAKAKVGVTYS